MSCHPERSEGSAVSPVSKLNCRFLVASLLGMTIFNGNCSDTMKHPLRCPKEDGREHARPSTLFARTRRPCFAFVTFIAWRQHIRLRRLVTDLPHLAQQFAEVHARQSLE
jgi:hypothetical protein